MEKTELIVGIIFLLFFVAESAVSVIANYNWYNTKDTAVNATLAILNFLLDISLKGVTYFILDWFHQFSIFKWSNPFLLWTTLIVLEDFFYYLLHLVDHNVRLFWAVHVNHHSSQKMNFSVAIRSSLFQPVYRFVYYIPLALLGFEAWQIMVAYLVCNWWGYLIHTEAVGKLGWMEKIFATPSNHRVHHGSNPHYLDRNMGMFLIIWDRIFGTYQQEKEKAIYGLTKNINTHRLDEVVFHEWKNMWRDVRNAKTLPDKFMYILGPPGWSADGKTKTSKQMRQEYFEKLYYENEKPFVDQNIPQRVKDKKEVLAA